MLVMALGDSKEEKRSCPPHNPCNKTQSKSVWSSGNNQKQNHGKKDQKNIFDVDLT